MNFLFKSVVLGGIAMLGCLMLLLTLPLVLLGMFFKGFKVRTIRTAPFARSEEDPERQKSTDEEVIDIRAREVGRLEIQSPEDKENSRR